MARIALPYMVELMNQARMDISNNVAETHDNLCKGDMQIPQIDTIVTK